ncbi:DNA-directed RNA polymerase subunit beta [Salmonella enterica]|uniref:DNA-directed RNA polymerase subunit beta n=1 Tax=Salmonella enterica TaxID=28901 RepID=UPI000E3C037A|nr:DNA-directed RNA polymerase subunit beta [Salmonella enterica]EAO5648865.1 DNA-directed RNA polymerase subunit beta [Salmonella enterica subsp. enterica]EAP5761357.1 DNA-directed RNA polymerase subunit beta [Salmonella enterica subsp. enterica serovar Barranquilla]HBU8523954.1 DNA-directed RNA polymerase subunit beta [Klebsiella aerogenes]EAA7598839.1 DNA-directed RNA polymerase subunit beta [Salmonella enterica]EAA8943089.1 DNA-directed RNA polymerase subunit beta [Salmonella enterica]
MRKFWLVAGAAVLIAGCGEESGFEKAINEKISKDGVCYGFSKENNAKVFDDFKLGTPVRVNIYSKDDEDPILIGLKNSGLLNISYEQEMFKRVAILETTDKGRKTNFWDRNNGTCIGHRTVAEITNWTEPSDNNGQKVTQVSYSWKLSGIPGWIDKQAFIAAGINGIDKPKESEIILVKTQKGWKARGL